MAAKKEKTPKPEVTTPNNIAFGLEDIGFRNAAANAARPTSAADIGGFTPVIPTGTITLPNGDIIEVADDKIIGPVDYTLGKPGDFKNPAFEPFVKPKAADDWTNQIYILINKLKAAGLPASTAERAGAFFTSLLDDGITDLDNAVDIFLYTKSYKSKKTGQEIPSPYYQDFGKFNDGLSSAKPPGVLVPWVLGIKDTLAKYKPGSLYETDDAMQKYLKNDVKVSELDERLNAARLRSVTADKAYVNALIQLKYINKAEDLTGFFASPDIGQKQLELNRNTGALAAEALRRAKEGGIQLDTEFAKQQAAALTGKGYSEGQVTAVAEKGYQQIARNIMPTVKVSGIYQGAKAATAGTIQSELQQQEFMGMDSQRYEMLAEQEARAFQGSSGNIRSPRISSYRDDITGQI